jgi:hypothetical protein
MIFNNNSRTAIVVFQLFLKMAMGQNSDWSSIIKFLLKVALGAYVLIFFHLLLVISSCCCVLISPTCSSVYLV